MHNNSMSHILTLRLKIVPLAKSQLAYLGGGASVVGFSEESLPLDRKIQTFLKSLIPIWLLTINLSPFSGQFGLITCTKFLNVVKNERYEEKNEKQPTNWISIARIEPHPDPRFGSGSIRMDILATNPLAHQIQNTESLIRTQPSTTISPLLHIYIMISK